MTVFDDFDALDVLIDLDALDVFDAFDDFPIDFMTVFGVYSKCFPLRLVQGFAVYYKFD